MELSSNVILSLAIIGMTLCGLSLYIESRVVVGGRTYCAMRKLFWVGLISLLCAPVGVVVYEIARQVWVWLAS